MSFCMVWITDNDVCSGDDRAESDDNGGVERCQTVEVSLSGV